MGQTGVDMKRSVAGLWSGKEAVVKALGSMAGGGLRGGGASLVDIVIRRPQTDGPVVVELFGDAKKLAERVGVKSVSLTLTYTEEFAVAAAVASLDDPHCSQQFDQPLR